MSSARAGLLFQMGESAKRMWYKPLLRRASRFLDLCTRRRFHYWANRRVIEQSGLFSEAFYVERYGVLIPRGMTPLQHFLTRPFDAPFDPNPHFDSAAYFKAYPAIADGRHTPLVDYVRHGQRHRRKPQATSHTFVDAQAAFTELALAKLDCFLNSSSASLSIPAADDPQVSIILLLHNRAELTLGCLESISRCQVPLEVIIIDNASTDRTSELLQRLNGVTQVANAANMGFGPAANQAVVLAKGEAVLFLNNDAELLPGSLEAAFNTLRSDEAIGAVGGKVLLLDGRLQEAGSVMWRDGVPAGCGRGLKADAAQTMFRRPVDYCSGCFLMTPRRLFLEVGGFDGRFAPSYYEDSDYCLRIWHRGKKVIYEPDAVIVHYESGSSPSQDNTLALIKRNQAKFTQVHKELFSTRPPAAEAEPDDFRFLHLGKRVRRVLFIDDFPPLPFFGSGLGRAHALVTCLVSAGFDITLVHTSGQHFPWKEIYDHLPRTVEVLSVPADHLASFLKCRAHFYDDLVVSRPNNLATVSQFSLATSASHKRPRLVYDAEALYFERDQSLAELLSGSKAPGQSVVRARERELRLAATADVLVSVSEHDQAILKKHTSKPVFVLGHELKSLPTARSWEKRTTLLFVGSLHRADSPNYDGLHWFLTKVAPLLETRMGHEIPIVVAGYNSCELPPIETNFSVAWVGRQEDLTSFYNAARVFVAPIRYAAGIPFKCLEAASRGVPMVVTDLLASQLGWTSEQDFHVTDRRDAEGFAQAVATVYNCESTWSRLRANALRRIATESSPERFRSDVEAVFSEAVHPEQSIARSVSPRKR